METLETFLKKKMIAERFDKLPALLQISQTKLTRILNRPNEATLDEVLNLAALLRVEAEFLVSNFKMGYDNISLSDNEKIILKVA